MKPTNAHQVQLIEIGGGDNAVTPGHRAGGCGVDASYKRMSVG
jgi:hypothetical protein